MIKLKFFLPLLFLVLGCKEAKHYYVKVSRPEEGGTYYSPTYLNLQSAKNFLQSEEELGRRFHEILYLNIYEEDSKELKLIFSDTLMQDVTDI
jgi:hypothetical protein